MSSVLIAVRVSQIDHAAPVRCLLHNILLPVKTIPKQSIKEIAIHLNAQLFNLFMVANLSYQHS